MSKNPVRVRFAPSPTGPLHIGGVRTALFNYLFAKKHNGTFILRIEDTDEERYVDGAEKYIIDSLKWLGIRPDEGQDFGGEYGPYRQSERKEHYAQYAQMLIDSDNAYYAFDSAEELQAIREKTEAEGNNFIYNHRTRKSLRNSLSLSKEETKKLLDNNAPYVIRFKMPDNRKLKTSDIIRGDVEFDCSLLDDKVLLKTGGMPTYHLANVVDDYTMKISHVIRGEEWLSSLPLHVLLYESLGWMEFKPEFAHLPLILKPIGKGKLSKRDGEKMGFPVFPLEWKKDNTVSAGFREDGYLPDAVVNMLALLGWNPGTEQEIFSIDELCNAFSLNQVSKAGAKFSPDKAKWFNHQYILNADNNSLIPLINKILLERGIDAETSYTSTVLNLVKDRITLLPDFWEQAHFFYSAPTEYDEKIVSKKWKEDTSEMLTKISEIIANSPEKNNPSVIKDRFSIFMNENGWNFGAIMNPMRIALVGSNAGPDLFDIIATIGTDEAARRIKSACKKLG
ncbi:MAG: glutamate--tRNA ligase [Bacteroidales bacterium]